MPALKLTLNKIINRYVIQHFNMQQVILHHAEGGNEIASHSDADSKCPLDNTTATSNPFSLSNNSTLDFFLLFGQRQLSVPIQVIPLSLQCYGTTLPSLTRLVSAPAHRASVTCGARKLLSLISCHQNVLAQPSQSTKRNRMWGWGQ